MSIKEIALRIWYYRNKYNISARELSSRIDKSPTYINQIESGNFTLSLPVFLKILEQLNITCAEFFADNYKSYNQDKEIIEILNKLPTDRNNSFIDLMKNTK